MTSPMTSRFTSIPKESVMCTLQGCPHVATFVFTGGIDCNSGGRSLVAAYCDRHAEEAAVRLGYSWPPPERRRPERVVRALASHAG